MAVMAVMADLFMDRSVQKIRTCTEIRAPIRFYFRPRT